MARVDVKLYVTAAILTLLIFIGIYLLNLYFNERRIDVVTRTMNEIVEDFEDIETTYYLMDFMINQNETCDILIEQLNYLESKLWKLDNRMKEYREVTKDFLDDEFYIREKKKLNRREIIHMSMISKLRKICNYNQTVILYFYGECEKNRKCDQQGFVLTYINQRIDPEISLFSFDADRNISSVNALIRLYNVTEYPCVVVEGHTHCGLHDKVELEELLCKYSEHLSICLKLQ